MGTRVKKFNPKNTRPDKKRDFYGPLPDVKIKANKLQKSFNEGYG